MPARRISILLMLAAPVPGFAQTNADASANAGALSGAVVEAKSQEPVRKALVTMRGDQNSAIGTRTDAAGKFEFHDLKPGSWTITVERDDYVAGKDSQHRIVSVRAGETTRDVNLQMVHTGSISGRLTDADGDPLSGVTIAVTAVKPGRTPGTQQDGWAITDDRGEYRAWNIAPGEYRISAAYRPRPEVNELHMQPPATEAWPTMWYPGAMDQRQASTVTVDAGADLRGYDFHLVKMSAARVRGRVATAGGTLPMFVMLSLAPISSASVQMATTVVRDPKGGFEFTGVLPGRYRLEAIGGSTGDEKLTASTTIDVTGSSVEGIQLTLAPPVSASGRLAQPLDRKLPPNLMVMLVPRDRDNHQAGGMAQVAADGSFTIKSVPRGDYDVVVFSATQGDDLYLSAIRMGDADALAEGVHVGERAPAPIEISLKPNGGRMDCTVKDDKGNLVPGAHVVLIPDPPRQQQLALHGECRTEAQGTCSITGITPGDYHAWAFAGAAPADYRDPDALKPFADQAKPVKVAEGDRLALDLTAIPDE